MKSVTFSWWCLVVMLTGICVLWQYGDFASANVGVPGGQSPGSRDTVWVPDDYDTIQDGILACPRGGTVMVRPGIYGENITFYGRPLSLIALEGSDFTFIEAPNYHQPTIYFDADDEYVSRIEGFTIRGGQFGIRCYGEHQQPYRLYIVDNVIEENGTGIGLNAISAWVQGNTIRQNYGSGGIATMASPMIVQNVIAENVGDEGGGITILSENSRPIIGGSPGMGNTITDNIGTLHPRAHDLYRQYPGDVVNARHNIWTVYPPTEYICSPLAEFDTDNGYGAAQIAQDVYISPLGDNSNSGLDPLNPLRNIHHALARLAPITPGTIRNLHLVSGTYSYISNAEYFPIPLFSNLRILGASMDSVVVDLPGFLGGFLLEECDSVTIANLTIQHSDAWAMQSNHGWDLDFRSLNLHHNDQGIVSSGDTLITVSNCIFSWNQTESSGGGIFIEHCYGEVINSTFFGNRAGECGGGIACVFSGELWVENCILWGNHAAIISPDIYGTAIPMITVTYTDIEQGWTSIGNISLDPQFVDTSEATPDFRLGHGSPCIDAGNPDPWYNDPNGTRNDMGAYGGPYAQGWMGVVDDRREDIIPSKPEIIALYPNPANPTATLIYQIAQPSWVSIDLYNILGQHITTLRKHPQLSGTHTIIIDGSRWSSGTYFCRIASGDFPVTRKFVIIR